MKIDKKQSEEKSDEKNSDDKWFYNESRVFTEYHEDKKSIVCESQDKRIYLNCKIIRTPKKKTLLDGNCKIDNVDFTIMQYIKLEKLPDDPFELVLKLFGGIKKKLSGVRGQRSDPSIPDSSKDELITYFIKAFRKISEVSKNKKTASSSGDTIATAASKSCGMCKICTDPNILFSKVTQVRTENKNCKYNTSKMSTCGAAWSYAQSLPYICSTKGYPTFKCSITCNVVKCAFDLTTCKPSST